MPTLSKIGLVAALLVWAHEVWGAIATWNAIAGMAQALPTTPWSLLQSPSGWLWMVYAAILMLWILAAAMFAWRRSFLAKCVYLVGLTLFAVLAAPEIVEAFATYFGLADGYQPSKMIRGWIALAKTALVVFSLVTLRRVHTRFTSRFRKIVAERAES